MVVWNWTHDISKVCLWNSVSLIGLWACMEWFKLCEVLRRAPGTCQVLSCTRGLTKTNPTWVKPSCILAFFPPFRKAEQLLELHVLEQKCFFHVADATLGQLSLIVLLTQKHLTQTFIPAWSQFTKLSGVRGRRELLKQWGQPSEPNRVMLAVPTEDTTARKFCTHVYTKPSRKCLPME